MDYYEITDNGYKNVLDNPIRNERIKLELLDHFENCIGVIEQDISANDGGSIVSNNEQGTRRSCSFTLINVDSKYTINENNFFWFNRKFKLYKGITDGNDTYYFAKGVFITQNADIDSVTSSVSISGVDKYGQLDGTLKVLQGDESDTVFEIGTQIEQVIKDILMLDIGNGLVLDPIEPIIDPKIGKQKLYKEYTMSAGSYFGDFLSEVMTSFGCDIFYDNLGRLTVRRVFNDDVAYWYAYKAPVWSFDCSKSGYIVPKLSSQLSGVNKITVKTDNTDSENASYTAYNNNPRSPLCYSKIGARILEENAGVIYISAGDATIDTPEIKCKEYAEYRLLKETCLSLSLDFSCDCIPHLNEGDIILITDPQFLFDNDAFFIQSITDSFDTGEIKISAVNLQHLPTDIYNDSNASRSSTGNINKIIIHYDLNGGTGNAPEDQLVSFFEPFSPVFPTTESEIPQKYGYEFAGWGSSYGRYTDSKKTYSAPSGNATLYAAWEKTDNTWFKIDISNFENLGITSIYPYQVSSVYDTEYTMINDNKKYIYQHWCDNALEYSWNTSSLNGEVTYIHGFSNKSFDSIYLGSILDELTSTILNKTVGKDTTVTLKFPDKLPNRTITLSADGFQNFKANKIIMPMSALSIKGTTKQHFLSNISGLEELSILKTIEIENVGLLYNCTDLKTVNINGDLVSKTETKYLISNCENLSDVAILGNIEIQPTNGNFLENCTNLRTVDIGGGLSVVDIGVSPSPTNICTTSNAVTNFNVLGDCTLRYTNFSSADGVIDLNVSRNFITYYSSKIYADSVNVGQDLQLHEGSSLKIGKASSESYGNFIVSGELSIDQSSIDSIYVNELRLGSLSISSGSFSTSSCVINNIIIVGDLISDNTLFNAGTFGNIYVGGNTTISGSAFAGATFTEGSKIEFHSTFDTSNGTTLCGCYNLKELYFYDSVIFSSTKANLAGMPSLTDIYFYNDDITYDLSNGSFLVGDYGNLTIHGISGGKAEELATAKNLTFVAIE